MFSSQVPYVELYRSLLAYSGHDAFIDVLDGWLKHNSDECRWFAEFAQRTNDDWSKASDEDLCHLYALFRVTSVLLLRRQSGPSGDSEYEGVSITEKGFNLFHEQLGFRVPKIVDYHPFYHEIVSVTPAPSDSPIRISGIAWPCLMLGDMLFCRAGCSVTGGISHVVKEIAESSTLYWTFRRRDRPCDDLSHGWGHNSQWRTAHRRDYCTSNGYHFNVDGRHSLNDQKCIVEDLTLDAMIELVTNRCLIRSRADGSDLFPYDYSYTEVVERR